MRSTLFSIPLSGQVSIAGYDLPIFGFGLLLGCVIVAAVVQLLLQYRREQRLPAAASGNPSRSSSVNTTVDAPQSASLSSNAISWLIAAAVVVMLPRFISEIPIRGYGTMLVLGFFFATAVAAERIRRAGYSPDIAWDLALWVFASGVIGCRALYVMQYGDQFFRPRQSLAETVFGIVNLPDGGLTLYGGVVLGGLTYMYLCWRRKWNALALGDIIITSVFIGVGLGRLGCFLHGCCYGDVCELPWGLSFPQGSPPYSSELLAGYIWPAAAGSLTLHPAQLYSSFDGFLLAALTWAYYPHRSRDGAVLLVGWVAYPISRFLIEILRGDEGSQLGTGLTISQLISLGLAAAALVLLLRLPKTTGRRPLVWAQENAAVT